MNKDSLFAKRNLIVILFAVILSALSAFVTVNCYELGTGLNKPSALPTVFYAVFAVFGLLCIFFGINTKSTLMLEGKLSAFEKFFSVFAAVIFISDALLTGYLIFTKRLILVGFDTYSYYIRAVFALFSAVYFFLRARDKKEGGTSRIYLSFAPLIYFALSLVDRLIDTDVNVNSPQKHLHIVSLSVILIFLLLESRMMTYSLKRETLDLRALRVFTSLSVLSVFSVVFVHIILGLLGIVSNVTLVTSDLCELSIGLVALSKLFSFRKYKIDEI